MTNKKKPEKKLRTPLLKDETRHTVLGISFFVLGVFLLLAPMTMSGIAGTAVYGVATKFVGVGFFLLPILTFLLGAVFARSGTPDLALRSIVGSTLFMLAGLGLLERMNALSGGVIGKYTAYPLVKLFDVYFATLFLAALIVISLLIMFDTPPRFEILRALFGKLFEKKVKIKGAEEVSAPVEEARVAPPKEEADEPPASEEKAEEPKEKSLFGFVKKKEEDEVFNEALSGKRHPLAQKDFVPPPLSLLEKDSGKAGVGDIKANANIIKRTLQNFGITVEMDEISIGPSVTRYALKPAEGVKLARIVGLQNELALALAAHPVRIEAPIPGTSLVGIEVPNTTKTRVGLGTLLSSLEWTENHVPLLITLGKSISGRTHFANMAKMPHLLVAGATGSGKSVMMHTMVTSLLYRNPPEDLRFIMIDPKRVELTLYNGIPHLLSPVITDAKKAILALRWAAKEMDRRYDILEGESVRDIDSYHKNVFSNEARKTKNEEDGTDVERMPYIVIIIDELADIMQTYPRELESAVVRLAQMSRAVGIHLVLSTQRPSVNIITGLIKANIPSRIALQVASQIDSRTILDTSGAEKLLGAGDMLYMSAEMSKPLRIQSAFVSEGEVKKVVKHVKSQYEDELPDEISFTEASASDRNPIFETSLDDSGDDDDLYEEARVLVIEAGKASTSYLQRRLKVGYGRAARLVDMLEERGVVGPPDGSKPREVIMRTPEEEQQSGGYGG